MKKIHLSSYILFAIGIFAVWKLGGFYIVRLYDLIIPTKDLYTPIMVGRFDYWTAANSQEFQLSCGHPNRWYEFGLQVPKLSENSTEYLANNDNSDIGGLFKLEIFEDGVIVFTQEFDGQPDVIYFSDEKMSYHSLVRFPLSTCEGVSAIVYVVKPAMRLAPVFRDVSSYYRVSPQI